MNEERNLAGLELPMSHKCRSARAAARSPSSRSGDLYERAQASFLAPASGASVDAMERNNLFTNAPSGDTAASRLPFDSVAGVPSSLNPRTAATGVAGAVSLVAAIVGIYVARHEVADLWRGVYPIGQFAGLLLLVVTLGAVMLASRRRPDPSFLGADQRLLVDFLALLPSSHGPVRFLSERDLGIPFRWESLEPLDEFRSLWDDAEHSFHDRKVDAERARLHAQVGSFLDRLTNESHPETHATGWHAVIPVERRDTFRLQGRADDIRRVDELNELAQKTFDAHQTFVSVARRRLGA